MVEIEGRESESEIYTTSFSSLSRSFLVDVVTFAKMTSSGMEYTFFFDFLFFFLMGKVVRKAKSELFRRVRPIVVAQLVSERTGVDGEFELELDEFFFSIFFDFQSYVYHFELDGLEGEEGKIRLSACDFCICA